VITEELEQCHPKTLAEHLGVRTDCVLVIAGGKAGIPMNGARAFLGMNTRARLTQLQTVC
jgi:hypothetical protein